MVFLGGCTTALLVTDPAAPDVRATMDVDMIVEAAAQMEFHAIEAAMRDRGFQPDMESGIRCRWRSGDFMASHDFEDIVTVIDGREELRAEIAASEAALRSFIGQTFAQWAETPDLNIALAGQLPPDPVSQQRYGLLERRFRKIASIR